MCIGGMDLVYRKRDTIVRNTSDRLG